MEAGLFLAGLVVGLVVGAAGMRLLGTRPALPATAPPAPAGPPATPAPEPPVEGAPGLSQDSGVVASQAVLDLDADPSGAPPAVSEESPPGTLSESSARLTEELERRYRGKRAEGPAEPRRGGGRRGPRPG
ncbi:MAG: hypothetical protein ACREPI_00815 [Candidatus Dormibacterales bacterium]